MSITDIWTPEEREQRRAMGLPCLIIDSYTGPEWPQIGVPAGSIHQVGAGQTGEAIVLEGCEAAAEFYEAMDMLQDSEEDESE